MRIGVVGDPHEPVSRAGYLDFCSDTFEQHQCDVIVGIGDFIDWHGISFHTRQPECPGAKDEYTLAYERMQRWYQRFPKVHWCVGNHDERPSRLAQTVNIPAFMLKPYNELWGVDGWEYDFSFVFDEALYTHGTGTTGVHPAWNLMNKSRQSVVMGHCHSRAGTKWGFNRRKRYFCVDTGCGVDDRTFQFAYGKNLPERSALACAVILDGQPISIAMPCGPGEKYHDSRFEQPAKPLIFIGKWGNKQELKRRAPVHLAISSEGEGTRTACRTEGIFEATEDCNEVTCGNCRRTIYFKEKEND